MRKILIFTFIVLVSTYACDKNMPFGTYKYIYKNNSIYDIEIGFYDIFLNDTLKTINISPSNEFTYEALLQDNNGFYHLLTADSSYVIFNNLKVINYSKGQVINNKNPLNRDTYEKYDLESNKKNEDNREYVYEITEQDYLIADTL